MRRFLPTLPTLLVLALAGCGASTPPGTHYDATYEAGPFTIAPGGDQTFCTFLRTDNAAEQDISLLHGEQSPGGHHLIVYAVDHAIDLPPQPCVQGGQPGWSQLLVTQTESEDVTLPPGVGFHFRARQQLVIETHYINATQSPINTRSALAVRYAPAGSVTQKAAPFFFGSLNIDLPPGQDSTVTTTCSPPQPIHLLRLFGHEHRMGTGVGVKLTSAGTTVDLYETTEWEGPPVDTFSPELVVQPNDSIEVSCRWHNGAADALIYPKEMCFAVGMYYPAQGTLFCTSAGGASGCRCYTLGALDPGPGGAELSVEVSRIDSIDGVRSPLDSGRPLYCKLFRPEDWDGATPKPGALPYYDADAQDVRLLTTADRATLTFFDVTPGDYKLLCFMDNVAGGFIPGSGDAVAFPAPTVTVQAPATTAQVTLNLAIP